MGLDALDARGQLLQACLVRGPFEPALWLFVWLAVGGGSGGGVGQYGDSEDRGPHLVRADTLCCAPWLQWQYSQKRPRENAKPATIIIGGPRQRRASAK